MSRRGLVNVVSEGQGRSMTIVEAIVAGEVEAVIVYRSENVIAFADHNPISFGHILICPTYPYQDFIDLPPDIYEEITRVARDLYVRIKQKFQPDGISFIQNNGAFNELGHYHLHIFPRYHEDGFGWHQAVDLGVQPTQVLRAALMGL